MSASILNAGVNTPNASVTENVSAANDFLLFFGLASTSTGHWITAISDTGGNTWTPVWGTLGAQTCVKQIGSSGYFAYAFAAVATGAVSGGSVSITWNTTPTVGASAFADCGGIASSGPVLGAIGIDQSSVSGTNAITCAGGTGLTGNNDDITSVPALVAMLSYNSGGTLSVGSSPTAFTSNATASHTLLESALNTSTTGTYDACATQSTSATVVSVQFALNGAVFGIDEDPEWIQYITPATFCTSRQIPRRRRSRGRSYGMAEWLKLNRAA